jgi:hypothetical protein
MPSIQGTADGSCLNDFDLSQCHPCMFSVELFIFRCLNSQWELQSRFHLLRSRPVGNERHTDRSDVRPGIGRLDIVTRNCHLRGHARVKPAFFLQTQQIRCPRMYQRIGFNIRRPFLVSMSLFGGWYFIGIGLPFFDSSTLSWTIMNSMLFAWTAPIHLWLSSSTEITNCRHRKRFDESVQCFEHWNMAELSSLWLPLKRTAVSASSSFPSSWWDCGESLSRLCRRMVY